MCEMGIHVSRMTVEPRIFSLQNLKTRKVTGALCKMRSPSIGKIWLPTARVAQMLSLKTSQLASGFQIPLTIKYLLEAWIREIDL